MKTFEEAFGKDAVLERGSGKTAPFYIASRNPYLPSTGDAGNTPYDRWEFDPETGRINKMGMSAAAQRASKGFGGTFSGMDSPMVASGDQYVNAQDISGLQGLTNQEIAWGGLPGLASQQGKNIDSWSDYAYKHGPNGGGMSPDQVRALASGLNTDFNKITEYDRRGPQGLSALMEKAIPLVIGGIATAGLGNAAGLWDLSGAAGAAESGLSFNPAMADVPSVDLSSMIPDVNVATEGGGYFGGIGGAPTGVSGLGMSGTSVPGIGVGGAAGSTVTPSMFSASELSSAFPGAFGTAESGSGAMGALKSASSAKDVMKSLGNNASSIGAIIGALTGPSSKTVSGGENKPAWASQGLASIQPQQYTSNKIQGDPYRYGMGSEQKLITNNQGDVYTPQSFGQGYGIPIAKAKGGGLGQYVNGGGSGQSDGIPAMLSPGEYVMDADIVSALGDGNNQAGARILDKFRENIRKHKRGASDKSIPPKSKPVESYLKGK